jgi:hypothetical protein
MRPTVVGGSNLSISMYWGYDLSDSYSSRSVTLATDQTFEFNTADAEFSIAKFSGGSVTSRRQVNTTGSGTVITVGVEADISGSSLSIQEINVYALLGKTL